MKAPAEQSPESQRQAAAHEVQQQNFADTKFQFVDNRAETANLRQLQAAVDNSPQAQGLSQLKAMVNNSPRSGAMQSIQTMVDNSPRRLVQRQAESEEEALVQGEFAAESPAQLAHPSEVKPNNTGLPDNLKAGVESLSGMSLDNVKVHYNSSQPAQLNAHAYAQGTDIHMGPGQEQHLPHEAWHVVQQAQGRVKPTVQMKDGVGINDDRGLEREADLMGGKAVAAGVVQAMQETERANETNHPRSRAKEATVIQQAKWSVGKEDYIKGYTPEINKTKIIKELCKMHDDPDCTLFFSDIADNGAVGDPPQRGERAASYIVVPDILDLENLVYVSDEKKPQGMNKRANAKSSALHEFTHLRKAIQNRGNKKVNATKRMDTDAEEFKTAKDTAKTCEKLINLIPKEMPSRSGTTQKELSIWYVRRHLIGRLTYIMDTHKSKRYNAEAPAVLVELEHWLSYHSLNEGEWLKFYKRIKELSIRTASRYAHQKKRN